ncbi:AcrR family transcriptional regulator [Kibdelosporangium banguiense]|uniref:AcrR family transcriptional regulator n=1 Tax=Kibdelosporangium banguiense TaxID=1365924 RepID=A0ABS4TCH6_9PSEU|nr:TetR/AcrR family transcriptional regulator [Kibdelosporangium banguiense]MBP2322127.1 AcrR family transcriptional regulator [Kibdelosporangium banguiense]
MPPEQRRTQEQRRATTRAALLAAAAELVVESGVRAVTLARVGERAGYSRGIVTHNFGSKQALLDALAKSSQSGFVPGVVTMSPGLERLLALVEGYVAELGRDSVASRAFLLLWAEAATAAELSASFRERDEAFRADLRDDVAAGIADGTIRADIDPQDVAVAVLGQLRGIGMQRLLDPDAVDTERVGRACAQQWRQALTVMSGIDPG